MTKGKPRSKTTGSRRLIFSLVMLALLLAALELMALVGLKVLDGKLGLRKVDLSSQLVHSAASQPAAGAPRMRFDGDLGWDTVVGVRQGGTVTQGQTTFGSSYGDSFTYCDEVREKESWQHSFKEQTGKTILNMGVNAYGTDQAYLKLEKYHEHYPARVVIMGLLADDIGRNGGIVGSFYLRTPRVSVKPRYVFVADGSLRLRPNPIRSEAGLSRLADVAYLEQIAQYDYWYQVNKQRYGFDLLRGRGFPHLLHLVTMIRGMGSHGTEPMDRYYFLRHPDEEPMRITRRILKRFKDRVRDNGSTPLVMLHSDDRDMKNHHLLEGLSRYIIKELDLPLFDVRVVLQEAINRGTARSQKELFMPRHHYSPAGNRIIASGLKAFCGARGLLDK